MISFYALFCALFQCTMPEGEFGKAKNCYKRAGLRSYYHLILCAMCDEEVVALTSARDRYIVERVERLLKNSKYDEK